MILSPNLFEPFATPPSGAVYELATPPSDAIHVTPPSSAVDELVTVPLGDDHVLVATPPSHVAHEASSHGKHLSRSGARNRANAIFDKYFDDLDLASLSSVLDALLRHSSFGEFTSRR